ncbi:MAG: nucleotidyltransferase [Ignavibacteriales bacterium]|nr:MAG: nucleotidyltransferase [Ignavibacteriales bacterium]
MKDVLAKHRDAINNYCKENHISKLSLFGSYLNNAYSRKSDIDLLVEFDKGAKIGLLDMSRIERELSELLNMKVDIRTPDELSRYFRDKVIKEAEVKYEAGR